MYYVKYVILYTIYVILYTIYVSYIKSIIWYKLVCM